MGLLRVIKKEDHNSAKIVQILNLNKQIKFVSLMGVDLGGNATDEKIPVELFKKDIDDFLYRGIQTDGSSVELHEIATLNNAKVDLLPDLDVNWYIDYNTELTDYETNLPVGTLKIPSFLIHNNKKVCSRGILQRATNNLENGLLRVIKKEDHNSAKIVQILNLNKQIKFVSLMGVDLGGNATDEKIPVELFKKDIDDFLYRGIQTDGSSVELHEIATLNNAKVDLLPDLDVNWYIDYNTELTDYETNLPVGTLKIPSFLIHNNKKVCSRGILQRATNNLENTLIDLLKKYPNLLNHVDIDSVDDIEKINITSATELEFWVSTPEDKADLDKLYVSQSLKEQYWKKTQGTIRSALERTLIILQELGVEPEMGHKEVGGIASSISIDGKTNHAMEQLEIDWKYSSAIQTADNEIVIRDIVEEVFKSFGLNVTFKAKPLNRVAGSGEHTHIGISAKLADNEIVIRDIVEEVFKSFGLNVTFKAKPLNRVAGSGEHTHIGISAKLKDGKVKNLFSPKDMNSDFMSEIGYGALMGILKNYEVLNPFVTDSNDALNRLVPGFEAPVCIVTSLGKNYEVPSRNRSVLIGLIRDIDNPLATRFELRAPNPLSNTYLVLASIYQAVVDGIKAVAVSNLDSKELEKEISKDAGETSFYLEKDRKYRDEENVFECYTQDEREKLFGKSPATVYENMLNLDKYIEKVEVLKDNDVFTDDIINSFKVGAIDRWMKELRNRIIQDNMDIIRGCKKMHTIDDMDALDEVVYNDINNIKLELMKDNLVRKSLFTQIIEALDNNELELASELQLIMKDKMELLQSKYIQYKKNIF